MSGLASNLTSPQLRGRLVFVDNRYGNNATGLVERPDRPFATIEAAFNAALAAAINVNDRYTVHVRPGTYQLTYGLMVKPADRTINFEFESGVVLRTPPFAIPANLAWLQIDAGTVLMSGEGQLIIIVEHGDENCFVRLNGVNSGSFARLELTATQITHVATGSVNASFVRCAASGPFSTALIKANRIFNQTDATGQAFVRWDGNVQFQGAQVRCDSYSEGVRMFYDGGALPKDHRFFSAFHSGSIGGPTPADSPVRLFIEDGTLISTGLTGTIPPLGVRPQSIVPAGAINVFSSTIFIPDVINDSTFGYGNEYRLGSVQFGGLTVNSFQPYTNNFSFQGGQLDANYHALTSGSIPPGGASPPVGWFIRNQLIKSFFVKADPFYIPGTGNIAFGTLSLGQLTPFVPAASITQNGLSIPLLSAPVGVMITAPADQIRIFADPTNTGNVILNGHLKIVAELGKAM